MLSANRVEIDAGALNIVSRQNTSNYLSRERSYGVSLAYTFGASANGGFSGSLNVGGGNSAGNFASVADQAGIRAGSGGFDIRVAGLTDLRGGVIASTAAAGLNALRTGTFRASNINNVESYNVNSYSFGVGTGSVFLNGTGGVNNTGGSLLPSFLGLSFTLPTYLTAYGSQSSTTLSAISPANVVITSGEALSLSALAGLSRDTSSANSALTRQFTEARRADIAQDFAAARQLVTEVSTFFANRAAEEKKAEDAAKALGVRQNADGTYPRDPTTGKLIAVNPAAQPFIDTAADIRKDFGSGSAARLIGTAISGAAGGNVTGSLGSFVQAAAVGVLQGLAVREVKAIADTFLRNGVPTATSEAVRTALQGLVGCAGAAPTGNCASGALGAASSVVLNNLITSLLQPEERDPVTGAVIPRSLADQQTRTALIATLTGAIAGALGANAGVASNAGVIETENNALARSGHFYDITTRLCTASPGRPCHLERTNTVACVLPGRISTSVVVSGELYLVYASYAEIFPAGIVRTTRTRRNSYRNTTTLAHPLSGSVDRIFSQDSAGNVNVRTIGQGTAITRAQDRLNQARGPGIFDTQNQVCSAVVGGL